MMSQNPPPYPPPRQQPGYQPPQPGYPRPPRKPNTALIIIGALGGAVVLALVMFLIIGALVPTGGGGGTGGTPECPTDMMWSEEEGRCVSAWITPPDDELVQPPANLAARLEVILAEHNYGEHKVDCGTEDLLIFVDAKFTCTSVKSTGSTHTITVTITKVDVAADSYDYDAHIDDTQTPPTTAPAPPPTTDPYPSKPKLDYKKQKASLQKFCKAFKYDDIYDGSGKISVNQAENILLLRDYEGGKHLDRSASKSLKNMAKYVLEFYNDENYSHRSAYKKDLKNMKAWAGDLCVEF
jgi:hypothetical protein